MTDAAGMADEAAKHIPGTHEAENPASGSALFFTGNFGRLVYCLDRMFAEVLKSGRCQGYTLPHDLIDVAPDIVRLINASVAFKAELASGGRNIYVSLNEDGPFANAVAYARGLASGAAARPANPSADDAEAAQPAAESKTKAQALADVVCARCAAPFTHADAVWYQSVSEPSRYFCPRCSKYDISALRAVGGGTSGMWCSVIQTLGLIAGALADALAMPHSTFATTLDKKSLVLLRGLDECLAQIAGPMRVRRDRVSGQPHLVRIAFLWSGAAAPEALDRQASLALRTLLDASLPAPDGLSDVHDGGLTADEAVVMRHLRKAADALAELGDGEDFERLHQQLDACVETLGLRVLRRQRPYWRV